MTESDRRIYAWALYDVANSAFATTVMAGFFPVFFKQYWAAELPVTETSFWLGVTNSTASLVVLSLAPILGACADQGGSKKPWLAGFTVLGAVAAGVLYAIPKDAWMMSLGVYALGIVGFSGSIIFYDALIISAARDAQIDRVSALGIALGYLGGGVLYALNTLMVFKPEWFGLPDVATAMRVAFLTVALWWVVFALPLLRYVPEPPALGSGVGWGALRAGARQLRDTVHHLRALKVAGTFLLAYWLYIDGVDTIVRMAVDYGLALGFAAKDMILALLLTQFVGFPAAIVFGRLGARLGPKPGIFIGLAVYVVIISWAHSLTERWEFYGIAIAIALVQGGVQSLSRSLYARLIPSEKAGEFFGFYNMLGKFAAVLGPALIGVTSWLTHSPRVSILVLLILFVAGAVLLLRVDVREGERRAAGL